MVTINQSCRWSPSLHLLLSSLLPFLSLLSSTGVSESGASHPVPAQEMGWIQPGTSLPWTQIGWPSGDLGVQWCVGGMMAFVWQSYWWKGWHSIVFWSWKPRFSWPLWWRTLRWGEVQLCQISSVSVNNRGLLELQRYISGFSWSFFKFLIATKNFIKKIPFQQQRSLRSSKLDFSIIFIDCFNLLQYTSAHHNWSSINN